MLKIQYVTTKEKAVDIRFFYSDQVQQAIEKAKQLHADGCNHIRIMDENNIKIWDSKNLMGGRS